ncbi:enoyl-CoA hydratase/isomerase family protein [Egicoccus halophilus]|uniref:Enoyl-CoA hydratase n=1 Tax=Egicoccus halophilus TaxID=1670830 RepID=A0A8J3EV57_9ACTN|nr:enoyl-CoA hydratase/isomerase family protein [Egicoccus halophilus]GGI08987.1 enoyl-CoA hydratase [Egicoccus halophilus]
MSEPVAVELVEIPAGTLRVITLSRPAVRNAMDTALLVALSDALDDADRDARLRGVLVTGAGGAFSAGADLREELPDDGRRRMELFTTVYEQLTLLRVPTAAAVEGYAVGGGVELVGACDLRVLARDAVLRFPGAIHGVPVGTARTVGQVGLSVAKDWVLSSRDVPAEEAFAAGFAQRLVPPGGTSDAARVWLDEVARRDPDTVALLKRLFNDHGGVRNRVAYENDALRAHAETGGLAPGLDRDLPRTVRPRRV